MPQTQNQDQLGTAVGILLRCQRTLLGITLDQEAERAGVSKSSLSQSETGHRNKRFNLERLTERAQALEIAGLGDLIVMAEALEKKGFTDDNAIKILNKYNQSRNR